MKQFKQLLVVACLILLASSCIEDTKYPFTPVGSVYFELSNDSLNGVPTLQYRLCASAFDYNHGQTIQPSTMTKPDGTQESLDNHPYGYPTYFSDFYIYNVDNMSALLGTYSFEMTNYYNGEVANTTTMLENAPSPEVGIVSIDTISNIENSDKKILYVTWDTVPEASYYNVEIYDADSLLSLNSTKNTLNPTRNNMNIRVGNTYENILESGNTYKLKVYSVKLKTNSSEIKDFVTSSTKQFIY